MLSIALGPVALPVAPVVLLLAVWVASWLASRLAAKHAGREVTATAGNAVFHAALLGLLAARLAHLAVNGDLYLDSPWSALDLRDGGWHSLTGVLAGAAWLLWRGLRVPALRRALAGGVLAGVALWIAASLATGTQDPPALPSLMLTEFDSGATVDLRRAARGRPLVVNLWASWCGPCRAEMPTLAAAQQREPGVGFLFVNQGESASAVRAYLVDQDLPLREVLLDSGSRLGAALGSRGLPTTLFYDARGKRIGAHFGVLNAAALQSRLREMRAAP
jgi:thiol-disulfide isomerase/thioredoxin